MKERQLLQWRYLKDLSDAVDSMTIPILEKGTLLQV